MAKSKTKKTVAETLVENPSYLYDEVLNECLKYFDGDELAATTWMNKYAMKNSEGAYVETTPDDMHKRMAKQFARMEEKHGSATELGAKTALLSEYGQQRHPMTEDEIYNLFRDFKYVIPQGSVMAALGNPYMLASLSNCVVIPEIHDSYGGIMYTDQQLVQLFKRRCGVGIDMSTIRPSGLRVNNAAGSTSGAVSFMERFSNTTREVSQNGRRGALMITMDIAHPDVEDFVTIKQDLSKVTGANISVRISDEFMEAVRDNKEFTHRWPIEDKNPSITKKVNARELWNTIIQ
ncbi:MAG: ribonucleotide reductase N-terminal alpha domain-containing protein, partial [Flavobacteriales bacterium]